MTDPRPKKKPAPPPKKKPGRRRTSDFVPKALILREKALAISKALQHYTWPLTRPPDPPDNLFEIHEVDYSRRPIDDAHPVHLLVDDFIACLPGQKLDAEAHRLWYLLKESSHFDSESEKTAGYAVELCNWLKTYARPGERMIFLDEIEKGSCVIILDNQAYLTEPVGYKILKYLHIHTDEYTNWKTIETNALNLTKETLCDERTIRRHIDNLPHDLRKLIESKKGKGRRLILP